MRQKCKRKIAVAASEVPAGVQAIPVLLTVGGIALYQRKKKAAQN
ncbi:MAG: hypothetical protein QM758_06400 [Armatimonas sp.]